MKLWLAACAVLLATLVFAQEVDPVQDRPDFPRPSSSPDGTPLVNSTARKTGRRKIQMRCFAPHRIHRKHSEQLICTQYCVKLMSGFSSGTCVNGHCSCRKKKTNKSRRVHSG